MTTAKGKVLEKIAQYNGEISERKSKIYRMQHVLSNIERLHELSDHDIRTQLNNERFHSDENFFSTKLSDRVSYDIKAIMGFCPEHIGAIDDPITQGIYRIDKEDYASFPFGETADPMLLSRFLDRSLTLSDYLFWMSGQKPIATREETFPTKEVKEYFIQRPDNYKEIVEEYKQSHPDAFKMFKRGLKYVGKLVG